MSLALAKANKALAFSDEFPDYTGHINKRMLPTNSLIIKN